MKQVRGVVKTIRTFFSLDITTISETICDPIPLKTLIRMNVDIDRRYTFNFFKSAAALGIFKEVEPQVFCVYRHNIESYFNAIEMSSKQKNAWYSIQILYKPKLYTNIVYIMSKAILDFDLSFWEKGKTMTQITNNYHSLNQRRVSEIMKVFTEFKYFEIVKYSVKKYTPTKMYKLVQSNSVDIFNEPTRTDIITRKRKRDLESDDIWNVMSTFVYNPNSTF